MVILTPADDLHGIVTVQMPQARRLLNDQFLRRVMVIHDLANGLPFHNDLIIRLKAHQL